MYTYINSTYKRNNIDMTIISFLINYHKQMRLNYDGSYNNPLLIKEKHHTYHYIIGIFYIFLP